MASEWFDAEGASPARRSPIPSDVLPGTRIGGKYELIRKIGSGAMGEVWAAKHLSLDEEVAIKLVVRDVAHDDGTSSSSRFLLEARVASQLSRKTRHIVSVTDHGEDGPYGYLVMELLSGESLEDRAARSGPMPVSKVVPIVYQIARALAVAHADGIVHRDLKPSNVFVTTDEDGKALVKILDFGIAKLRPSMRHIPVGVKAAKHTTMQGFLLGTPAFMSPEQARGMPLDHRADVWALAVIAYHLLTQQFPFDGETVEALFDRLLRVDPVPIAAHRPDLPPAVVEVFERAFSERMAARFHAAVALVSALEQADAHATGVSVSQPMTAISLPPPPPGAPGGALRDLSVGTSTRSLSETTLVAAGVPHIRSPWLRALGGVGVLAVLAVTASLLFVYFERDPVKPVRVTEGAVAVDTQPVVTRAPPREPIPAPSAILTASVPDEEARAIALSAPAVAAPAQTPARPASAPAPLQDPSPTATTEAPPEPTLAAPRPPPKRVDRSEVF